MPPYRSTGRGDRATVSLDRKRARTNQRGTGGPAYAFNPQSKRVNRKALRKARRLDQGKLMGKVAHLKTKFEHSQGQHADNVRARLMAYRKALSHEVLGKKSRLYKGQAENRATALSSALGSKAYKRLYARKPKTLRKTRLGRGGFDV